MTGSWHQQVVKKGGDMPTTNQGPRVLVVDDDHTLLALYRAVLERYGYQVSAVASGEEALLLLTEEGLALIITDFKMPGMSGLELALHVRSRGLSVPMIMISASTLDHLKDGLTKNDVVLMEKPVGMKNLLGAVASALAGSHSTVS